MFASSVRKVLKIKRAASTFLFPLSPQAIRSQVVPVLDTHEVRSGSAELELLEELDDEPPSGAQIRSLTRLNVTV